MANYILQVNYEKLTFSTLQVELFLIFLGGDVTWYQIFFVPLPRYDNN